MMRTMEMTMMDRMMNSQIPTQPGQMGAMGNGGNMEEVLDSSGKVVKRIFYNNTPQNGNSNQDITNSPVFSAVTTLFSTMLNNQGKEKEILLQKLNTPDNAWKDLAETFVKSSMSMQNPTAMVSQMIDIADKIRPPQQQNNDVSKSIEATKLEVDSKIALGELALKRLELEHNFQMDEKQSSQDNNNVDRWLDALQGLGESVIKPVAMKFVEGMGQGKFPIGGPLGAMLGQNQGQQQQEQALTAEQQQAIAMMQREQAMRQHRINQQLQNEERPMPTPQQMQQQQQFQPQNIPPIRPMPITPRPTQQQVMQQQQMQQQQQQNMSFEESLGNMSYEQLQELNYRIEMEDVKKERVKNHIKALMNAKKGNQNPRNQSQQMTREQQEAANILNFNQPPPQQEEEDEEYDEEEDYEIPIASGLPKNDKVKDLKKNTVNMYENESDDDNLTDNTTSLIAKKKLTNEEKALLATGQLSPEYIKDIEDDEDYDEDAEDDDNGIQIAGVKNASDVQKQQQLEEQREKASKKQKEKSAPKKKAPVKKIAEDVKEFDEPLNDVIEETDSVLSEADEIIPSDDE